MADNARRRSTTANTSSSRSRPSEFLCLMLVSRRSRTRQKSAYWKSPSKRSGMAVVRHPSRHLQRTSGFDYFVVSEFHRAQVQISTREDGHERGDGSGIRKCGKCGGPMRQKHRTGSDFEKFVRVLWSCPSCNASEWRKYGGGIERERRARWH
jgi:hypothetical protein